MTTFLTGMVCVLVAALFHTWFRLGQAESQYRKLCLVSTAITLQHGKASGNVIELAAPAKVPSCDIVFGIQIRANDRVAMQVELDPGVPHRKREPPAEFDEDMALALA